MLSRKIHGIQFMVMLLAFGQLFFAQAFAQTPNLTSIKSRADTMADLSIRLADAARNRDSDLVRELLKQGIDVNAFGSDGTPALHWAVRVQNTALTRELIDAGANVNLANRYGLPPLTIAATGGNVEMLKILLDAGADPNIRDGMGETVLMTAAKHGHAAIVKTLLENEALVNAREEGYDQNALMYAVRDNHKDIVSLLIARGADVNVQTKTGATPARRMPGESTGSHGDGIIRGGWPKQGMRYPVPGGKTPLIYAAREGHIESAMLLLDGGADLEKAEANGMTPLLIAILNDKMVMAKFLIERGANVNAIDWYGESPLWAAVDTRNMVLDSRTFEHDADREGALNVIKLLLQRGAEVNHRVTEMPPSRSYLLGLGSLAWVDTTGQTAFFRAASAGDVTVMKLLLEHGADPNIATFEGTTPLMAAAGVNWVFNETYDEGSEALLEAVKICHAAGNKINATNSMGLAAIHGAANRGSDSIIEYLATNGADLTIADNYQRTPLTWAKGVFLATHAPEAKPSSIALLNRLLTESGMNKNNE